MKVSLPSLFLVLLAALPLTVAAAAPEVIYWNSDAGKALRARIRIIGVSIAIVFTIERTPRDNYNIYVDHAMKADMIHSLTDSFEAHAQQTENGVLYQIKKSMGSDSIDL